MQSFPFILFFTLILISMIFFTLPVYSQSKEAVNISNSDGEARRVQIFVEANNVYTVWTDDTTGNSEVFFSKSSNKGESFEKKVNLSSNNGSSAFPRLVSSGPNVYVVWYDYTPGQSDIFFGKSNDTGKTFHTTQIRTPDPSYNPWIATSSELVYLVWNDGGKTATMELPGGEKRIVDVNTGDEEIFFGKSSDGGKNFEFSNISNSPGKMSWDSRIRTSGSDVFVVWNEMTSEESDIFFSKSSDYGDTFSTPINVSKNPNKSDNAGIAISGNNIYLVWNQVIINTTDVFFAHSQDSGKSFSEPINLSNTVENSEIIRDSQIVVSGSNVMVVWEEKSGENSDVFFSRSIDGGSSFKKPINLSLTKSKSEFPQIVANQDKVFVMWHDYSLGNGDIFLRESSDTGATFGSIINISDDDEESNIFILGPQIFFSENLIYTVWQNKFENSSDLFLRTVPPIEKLPEGQVHISTINDSTNIELNIEKPIPELDEPTKFSLRFFDAIENYQLKDVNYSFEIINSNGKSLFNFQNQYSPTGEAIHNATFSEEGPYTVKIEILGTGPNLPYQQKNTGIASATITVIPEFSSSVIIPTVAIGFGFIILIYRKLKLTL